MGNKAKRRAWAAQVNSDPRLSEFDRQVAFAVAEADRRGFTLCEKDGEFYFEPKDEYVAAKMAA